MTIKKKTLYVSLLLTFVILTSLLLSYLMGWFGNTPKLTSYESLMDICTVEKKLFTVSIQCDTFVLKTEERDGKNCLDLSVLNNDYTDIIPLEVCQNSKILDISDPVLDTTLKVPMHMSFKYTYSFPISYKLSKISMELIDDEGVNKITSAFDELNIYIKNVRLQKDIDEERKGYYLYNSRNPLEGIEIKYINFLNIKIDSISVENDEIVMDIFTSVNNVLMEKSIRAKEISYLYHLNESLENIIINTQNISEIDISKSYVMACSYLPMGTIINQDQINSYCNDKKLPEGMCSRKDNLDEYILDKDIDEYVKMSIDKLICGGFFLNNE